jgi:hypothetical protein
MLAPIAAGLKARSSTAAIPMCARLPDAILCRLRCLAENARHMTLAVAFSMETGPLPV